MLTKIHVWLAVAATIVLLARCGGSEAPPEEAPPEPPEVTEAPPVAEPEVEARVEPEPAPAPEPTGPPKVRMETSMGSMVLELYPDRAPETVANFLKYVDEEFYDRTIFHRVIPSFMVQGGGFTASMSEKQTRPGIRNEAGGLSNVRYSISMARTSDPHSATAQFFINHVTNRGLDKDQAPDGWGYCAFGKVVEGTEVIDKIAGVPTGNRDGHQNVPVTPVLIRKVERVG